MQPLDPRRAEHIAGDLAAVLDTLRTLTAHELRQVLRALAPPERRSVRRQSARLVDVLSRM